MNNEARTLWIALGSGIFAAFMLYSWTQEKKAEYDAKLGAMIGVVIASKDIPEMSSIDDTMLEIIQRPKDYVEEHAIKDPELAIGKVAAVPIRKGEQVLPTKLLELGPDTGIALQVAPEKRAITIPVDEVRAVAKLIRPGDRIDIFAAIDVGKGATQRREVSLLMNDVVVLATGVKIMNAIPRTVEMDSSGKREMYNLSGDTKYTSITIEGTPKEVQDIIYLMSSSPGSIFLTLRNPNDRKSAPRMPSSNADSLMGRVGLPLNQNEQQPSQLQQQRPSPGMGR